MKHENIIELVDVFGHVSSVSIVMDFMDTDLEVTEESPAWKLKLWSGDYQGPEPSAHPSKHKIIYSPNASGPGIPASALDSTQVLKELSHGLI